MNVQKPKKQGVYAYCLKSIVTLLFASLFSINCGDNSGGVTELSDVDNFVLKPGAEMQHYCLTLESIEREGNFRHQPIRDFLGGLLKVYADSDDNSGPDLFGKICVSTSEDENIMADEGGAAEKLQDCQDLWFQSDNDPFLGVGDEGRIDKLMAGIAKKLLPEELESIEELRIDTYKGLSDPVKMRDTKLDLNISKTLGLYDRRNQRIIVVFLPIGDDDPGKDFILYPDGEGFLTPKDHYPAYATFQDSEFVNKDIVKRTLTLRDPAGKSNAKLRFAFKVERKACPGYNAEQQELSGPKQDYCVTLDNIHLSGDFDPLAWPLTSKGEAELYGKICPIRQEDLLAYSDLSDLAQSLEACPALWFVKDDDPYTGYGLSEVSLHLSNLVADGPTIANSLGVHYTAAAGTKTPSLQSGDNPIGSSLTVSTAADRFNVAFLPILDDDYTVRVLGTRVGALHDDLLHPGLGAQDPASVEYFFPNGDYPALLPISKKDIPSDGLLSRKVYFSQDAKKARFDLSIRHGACAAGTGDPSGGSPDAGPAEPVYAQYYCFVRTGIKVQGAFDEGVGYFTDQGAPELYGSVCLQSSEDQSQGCIFALDKSTALTVSGLDNQQAGVTVGSNSSDVVYSLYEPELLDKDVLTSQPLSFVEAESLNASVSGHDIEDAWSGSSQEPLQGKLVFKHTAGGAVEISYDMRPGACDDGGQSPSSGGGKEPSLSDAENHMRIVEKNQEAISAIREKVQSKSKEAENASSLAKQAGEQSQDKTKYQEASKARDAYAIVVAEEAKAQELAREAFSAKGVVDDLSASLGDKEGFAPIKERADAAKAAIDSDLVILAESLAKAQAALSLADSLLPPLKFCFALSHIELNKRLDAFPDNTAELYGDVCLWAGDGQKQCLFEHGRDAVLAISKGDKHAVDVRKTIEFAKGGDSLVLSSVLKDKDVTLDDTIALQGFEGLGTVLSGYKIQEKSLLDGLNPLKSKIVFDGVNFEVDVHMGFACESVEGVVGQGEAEELSLAEAENNAKVVEGAQQAISDILQKVIAERKVVEQAQAAAANANTQNQDKTKYQEAVKARNAYAVVVSGAAKAQELDNAATVARDAIDALAASLAEEEDFPAIKQRSDAAKAAIDGDLATLATEVGKADVAVAAVDALLPPLKFCFVLTHIEVVKDLDGAFDNTAELYGDVCLQAGEGQKQCLFQKNDDDVLAIAEGEKHALEIRKTIQFAKGIDSLVLSADLKEKDVKFDDTIIWHDIEGLGAVLSGYKIQEKSLLDGTNPLKSKIVFDGVKFEVDVHMGLACTAVPGEGQEVEIAADLAEADRQAKIVEAKQAEVSAILTKVVAASAGATQAQTAATNASQDAQKYQEVSKARDAYATVISEADKAKALEPVAKAAKDAVDALAESLGSEDAFPAIKQRSDNAKTALDNDLATIAGEITKAETALAAVDALLPPLKFCFALTHIEVVKDWDGWGDDTAELYGDVCLQAGDGQQQCLFEKSNDEVLPIAKDERLAVTQVRKTIQFAKGGDLLVLNADLRDEDIYA